MKPLMLATGNLGKVAEFRTLLATHLDLSQFSLVTPRDWSSPLLSVAETGATFIENAVLKARSLAEATGVIALADDSGLCVDALGGEPGIHSARWAGDEATDEDRVGLLLERLRNVPAAARMARFVCAIAVVVPDGETLLGEGFCEGLIMDTPRGANGFGYDPIFFLPQLGRTMAELSAEEKNEMSHRAMAIQRIAPDLAQIFLRSPV